MRSLDVPGNEKSKDKLESKVKSGLQGERPKLRTRSSSLTLLDSLSDEAQQMVKNLTFISKIIFTI